MFISSTILYFDERPIGYRVIKTEQGLVLEPAPDVDREFVPPTVTLTRKGNGWETPQDLGPDLEAQVLKLALLHPLIELDNELSVAP